MTAVGTPCLHRAARVRERGVRLGRPLKLDALEILRLRRDGLSVRAIARSVGAPASTVARTLRVTLTGGRIR